MIFTMVMFWRKTRLKKLLIPIPKTWTILQEKRIGENNLLFSFYSFFIFNFIQLVLLFFLSGFGLLFLNLCLIFFKSQSYYFYKLFYCYFFKKFIIYQELTIFNFAIYELLFIFSEFLGVFL